MGSYHASGLYLLCGCLFVTLGSPSSIDYIGPRAFGVEYHLGNSCPYLVGGTINVRGCSQVRYLYLFLVGRQLFLGVLGSFHCRFAT